MPAAKGDLIGVVEAAYRMQDDDTRWIEHILDAAESTFFAGLGGVACYFDRDALDVGQILTSLVNRGMDPELFVGMRSSFEQGGTTERDRSLRAGGPVVRLTQLAGMPLERHPVYRSVARRVGFEDVVTLKAANPDGTGVLLATVLPRRQRASAVWDHRWARVGAHLAAGMRLQLASTRLSADDADAVLTPAGRVLSARGATRGAREALRTAAIGIERARRRRWRNDDAALDLWSALVDGRWSLVERFESDGKRFLLASQNFPEVRDPRALTPQERPLLQYLALGHSNKLIAYELGLPEGTVATRVRSLARKLGVRSRVELIELQFAMRAATVITHDLGSGAMLAVGTSDAAPAPEGLSAAEREVSALVLRGLGTREIARRRRCSPHTVSNLLASLYRKLGITSRGELPLAAKSRLVRPRPARSTGASR